VNARRSDELHAILVKRGLKTQRATTQRSSIVADSAACHTFFGGVNHFRLAAAAAAGFGGCGVYIHHTFTSLTFGSIAP